MLVAAFGIFPSAQAELATDSPAFLTGSIASASATTVTLKLEDGRTERKIPRKFFPTSTDFYPGRIISLKVTDELKAAVYPNTKARDLTNAELVHLIHSMQKGIGQKKTDKGESAALEAPTPILDFFSIRSSYAATTGCAPFSEFGMILKSRDAGGGCNYDPASACANPAQINSIKSRYQGERAVELTFQQCNPLVYGDGGEYGPGLCKSNESKADSCAQQFANSCRYVNLAGKENEKACIEKLVLPYVKEHRGEFNALGAALAVVCPPSLKTGVVLPKLFPVKKDAGPVVVGAKLATPESAQIADPALCTLDAQDRKNIAQSQDSLAAADQGAYQKEAKNERSTGGCVLLEGEVLNADVTDKTNTAKFTTITASMCGGQTLCVREVKCKDPDEKVTTGVSRFVRCRADQCSSAKACLEDRLVAGSSAKTAIPVKSSSTEAQ